jgi:hypothetical protein
VKAIVTMKDGTNVYTKRSSKFKSNGKTGLDVTYANTTNNTLTAPAEDATFFLPNGGKTFYMQNPLEITSQDIAAKQQ